MKAARRKATVARETPKDVERAYLHVQSKRHNAASLAETLGVSTTTVARILDALRRDLRAKGMELASVRTREGWHYTMLGHEEYVRKQWEKSPLRRMAGMAKEWKAFPGKTEDEIIYGED
jgi:chromosome segregation and condensation protein ScpB